MGVGQLCWHWHWHLLEVCRGPCPLPHEGENWIICLGVGRRRRLWPLR